MGFQNNTAETEQILTENYERYYRLAYSYMRNEDDALDVVQESAYRAIRDCRKVRNKDYLSTWIYRIVVRGTAGDTGRGPIPGPGAEDRIKPAGRQKQDHYPAAVL